MASQVMPEMYCLVSVVCGHHIYQRVWTHEVGKKPPLDIGEDDGNDSRAIALRTYGFVVGHVLKACLLA